MFNILDMIMYEFAHNDDYLTGTFAHANKKGDPDLPWPTRLRGDRLEYNAEKLKAMDKDRAVQFAGELVHMALCHPDRLTALVGTADHLRPLADLAFQLATHHTLEHENRPVNGEIFLKPSMIKGPDGNPLPDFLSGEEYFAKLVQRVNDEGIPIPNPNGEDDPGQGQDQQQQGQGESESEGEEGQGQGQGQGEGQDQGQKPSAFQQMAKNLGVKQPIQDQDTSSWGSIPKSLQEYHKIIMKQVLQKHRGNLPAGMERLLEQLETEEEEDFKRIIDRMVGSKFTIRKFKGSMKKPSRRLGVGFPGRKRLKRGALVYVMDSSGSMGDHEMAVTVSKGKHIAKRYGAPFLCLVCDAKVHTVKMINRVTDMDEVKIIGNGGTSSFPVFNYLEENKIKTDLLIYITDLYIDFPPEKPRDIYQVIWAVTNNPNCEKPPFGDVIHVKIPEQKS